MKHIISYVAATAIALCGATSCKTSEEAYRAAYEKAVAGREDADPLEGTVYGAARRPMDTRLAVTGTDTAEVVVHRVRVTEGGGGEAEWLHSYNVVVGRMKQRFNALSLRERLTDEGYPRAFVVETAEPYYYIVVGSYDSEAAAVAECARLRRGADFPVPLRAPLPFILKR